MEGGTNLLREWDEEADARLVVASVLGGTTRRVDPGGGAEQLHDFDLETPSGLTVAVEVTRHTLPEIRQKLAEVDRRRWLYEDLTGVWIVDMRPVYDVPRVHSEIAGHLAAFENASVDHAVLQHAALDLTIVEDDLDGDEAEFRQLMLAHDLLGPALELFSLGARVFYRVSEAVASPGTVIMSDAPVVGSSNPANIVSAIEHHANEPGNATKLRKATDRSERHLFVWIENSYPNAVAAFDWSTTFGNDGLPSDPPELPDEVDGVWAATGFDVSHVWRFHRLAGWEDLGFVDLRALRAE